MEQKPGAPYTELVLEAIDFVPESVLDVGCGNMGINTLLKQKFPQAKVVGCDISVEQLFVAKQIAEKMGLDIAYDYVDIGGSFPYPDKSFDVVISTATLMMVPGNVALNAANSMKRIARKRIILAELHGDRMGDWEIEFGSSDTRYARDYGKYFGWKKFDKVIEVPGWPGETYRRNGSVITINV